MRSFIGEDSEYVLLDVHGGKMDLDLPRYALILTSRFVFISRFPGRSLPIWRRAEITSSALTQTHAHAWPVLALQLSFVLLTRRTHSAFHRIDCLITPFYEHL